MTNKGFLGIKDVLNQGKSAKSILGENPFGKPEKKKAGRKQTSREVFERLYTKYKGKCQLCCKHKPRGDMTVDHVKPVSKGGSDDFRNKQILCHSCNTHKGNSTMAQTRKKYGYKKCRK